MHVIYCLVSIYLLFYFTSPYTLRDIYRYYSTHILNKFERVAIVQKDIRYDNIEGRPSFKYKYNNFRIWEIYNVLSEAECKEIIRISQDLGFNNSEVFKESGSSRIDTYARVGKTMWVREESNSTIQKIQRISAELTNIPKQNQEFIQVAQYNTGGLFIAHYDPCDIREYSKEVCEIQNRGAGPRIATLLIYLNDDYTGGQTEFPKIPFVVQPKQGKAILFWNTDDEGNIHDEAMHRGLTVLSGEKYICTVWSHIGPYDNSPKNQKRE